MQSKEFSLGLFVIMAILATASLVTSASAQEVRTLHNFLNNGRDGTAPRQR
jgi:hypothetical protein